MLSDQTVLRFNEADQFRSFIEDINKDAHYERRIPVTELEFFTKPEGECKTEEDLDTYHNGTKLWLRYQDNSGKNTIFPVRECAMYSVYARCAISGRSLYDMPVQDLITVLNLAAATRKTHKSQIYTIAGKISAVLSDNDNQISYVPIPIPLLFDKIQQAIWAMSGLEESFTGWYSFSGIQTDFVTGRTYELLGEEMNVRLELCSSDIGQDSVTIRASLVQGNEILPFLPDIAIPHRYGATELMFEEKLSQLDSAFDESYKRLNGLKNIPVAHPDTMILRLGKSLKLPKAEVLQVAAKYSEKEGDAPTDALKVYKYMARILNLYNDRQKDPFLQKQTEANLLRILGCDFSKYDLPGSYSW